MTELPKRFNYKYYILLNPDLEHLNEEDAISHYKNNGFYENRKYHIISDDFNYKDYLFLNPDLTTTDEKTATIHYEKYGFFENRKYKIEKYIDLDNESNITDPLFSLFLKTYDISIDQYKKEYKIQYRYICFKYIPYIKNISLPYIPEISDLEAVLIEYRCFPHIEFIIRNNIIKLGSKWSHTIICGNLNYDYLNVLCKNISKNITVIKTNYDNLMPSEYSQFLTTKNFWNLLKGKKILIYQEDSLIFKKNINDFLNFDYIGAPWPLDNNDNKKGVGNGGLSLRTKEIMLKIINTINIVNTCFNTNTLEYMKNTNSFVPPEDVYFTKNMEDYDIGILADRENAMKFSTESVKYDDSFGGHSFWYSDTNWVQRIYNSNFITFKPFYDLSILEHRGGWGSIINSMNESMFFNEKSKYYFFDIIEKEFLWRTDYVCENKWAGIIHCTSQTPPYLKEINIENMFNNENFIKSLPNCMFIVSLSNNLTKYLKRKINEELNLDITIYTIYHPVVSENIPYFDMQSFIDNDNKNLIQVGQQLRKMSSIYLLNSISCNKMWLTGTKKFERVLDLLEKEIAFLNIDKNLLNPNIVMHYTESFEEYDELLCKNLVFIHLFDASANNTVLECIIRNTPIIVNKLEGVVDYLGPEYPLYFNHLEEVPHLINTQKIEEAHKYLKQLDKSKFTISHFINSLYNIINEKCLR